MLSYYSADYCGTARNKRLHTSNRQYGVPRRCNTLLCRGGETERERERVGDQDKDGWWMDAHGWPAQARNGGCPVKALAVVSFGG